MIGPGGHEGSGLAAMVEAGDGHDDHEDLGRSLVGP